MGGFAVAVSLWAAAGLASAAPPGVAALVARLGHPDFAEREAAAKNLAAVGEPALPALRAATGSEDAEVARRAADLVLSVSRDAEARRLLAPTLVTLAAPADGPLTLAQVASAWSKASGLEFVVAPAELGRTLVASRAAAPVPLWAAVETVAQELNLDVRRAADRPALTLTPSSAGKRPGRFTAHALAVEAMPTDGVLLPPEALSVVLQTYAEPKLRLRQFDGVVVTRATDAGGRELRTLPTLVFTPPAPVAYRGRGLRGGGAIVLDGNGVALVPSGLPAPAFAPSASQALVRFAVPEDAPQRLAVLEGFFRATVVGADEELCRVGGLDEKPLGAANGRGVGLTAHTVPQAGDGASMIVVSVTSLLGQYQYGTAPPLLLPAATAANLGLPRRDGQPLTPITSAASGLVVTDAAGEPFEASAGVTMALPLGDGRYTERLTLRLLPTEKTRGVPATVTLSGARTRPLDIPFTLRDVPLSVGPTLPTP